MILEQLYFAQYNLYISQYIQKVIICFFDKIWVFDFICISKFYKILYDYKTLNGLRPRQLNCNVILSCNIRLCGRFRHKPSAWLLTITPYRLYIQILSFGHDILLSLFLHRAVSEGMTDVFYCFLQMNFRFAYYNQIIKYEKERKS